MNSEKHLLGSQCLVFGEQVTEECAGSQGSLYQTNFLTNNLATMPRESRKLPVSTALQSAINLLPDALLAAHDRAHKSSFLLMSWPRGHAGKGWLVLQVSWAITLQDMTNCLEALVKPFNHFISLILVFIVFAVNLWQQLNLHPALSGKWSVRPSHGSRAEAVTSQCHSTSKSATSKVPVRPNETGAVLPSHSWMLVLPQWKG